MSEVGSEEAGGRSASPSESSGDPPPVAPGAEGTTGTDSEAGADTATRTDAETGPETGAETAETGAETDTETKSETASEAKVKDRGNSRGADIPCTLHNALSFSLWVLSASLMVIYILYTLIHESVHDRLEPVAMEVNEFVSVLCLK